MPVDPKSKKPAAKADTKLPAKTAKSAAPAAAKSAKKASSVPASKTPKPADAKPVVRLIPKKPAAVEAHAPKVEKAKPAAKTKAKPKAKAKKASEDDEDLSDIEADLVGEEPVATEATTEKVKPLRMKVSRAKERALTVESDRLEATKARFLAAIEALGRSSRRDLPEVDGEDPAAILFTSGSTGAPKGVCYEHGMFEAQVRLVRDTYGIQPGEVDLPMLPIFALFNPALGMTTVVPEIEQTVLVVLSMEKVMVFEVPAVLVAAGV